MESKAFGRSFAIALTLVVLAGASSAAAQVDVKVAPDVKSADVLEKAERKDGWDQSLNLGATFSLNDSRKVVGSVEGATIQLGLVLGGRAALVHGSHDWDTDLEILHTQTRTPQADRFVKSTDAAKLKSFWGYHLEAPSWLGPFAQFKLDTQLLKSFDVATTDVTLRKVARDGSIVTRTKLAGQAFSLASPFEPMVLAESLGLFARPLTDAGLSLEAKAGAGAQQIVVGDGYTLADDKGTPELDLLQLRDTNQLGAVLEVGAKGTLDEAVSWQAGAAFFYPIYSSVDLAQTGFDTMSTELNGKLSVKIAKWASLDYVLLVKRVPLILDAWQLQNGIMLTAGFNLL